VKLVGRVPVEPLGDERITNIERAIVAGAADAAAKGRVRESRLPMFGFALATVVLVAGAGLIGWKLRDQPETPVVAEAAPLTVKSDGATTMDIGDAKLAIDPSTQLTVTRPGTGVVIAMAKGKLGLEVGKRGNRDPLIVKAGDTDVIVVGTAFTVDYDGIGDVDVRVTEGVVKVVRARREERIAAGEAWQTTSGKIALADAKPRAQVAVKDRTPDEIVIPIDGGKDIGLRDRTAKVPEARIPTTGTIQSGSGDRTFGLPENVRPTTPAVTPTASLYQDTLAQLRAAKAKIKPVSDIGNLTPTAAVSMLREQSLKTGPEASAAFYSIAVLQATKLGRTADAISTLDAYVRRFRGGSEYKAALWLRVVIKCEQRVDDHCRQAAFTYAHEDVGTEQGRLASTLSTMTSE
jgi:hypothetical protein